MTYLNLFGAIALSTVLWGSTAGGQVCSDATKVTMSVQHDGTVSEIFVTVGDQVSAGDSLLDLGASPQAVLTYKQAQTTVTLKMHALERKQQLFKQQLVNRDDVKNAEKDLSDAQSTVRMLLEIGSIKDSEILSAPFDGLVTAISVARGDRVAAGVPLMTLCRT